jgi:hypothetical protein
VDLLPECTFSTGDALEPAEGGDSVVSEITVSDPGLWIVATDQQKREAAATLGRRSQKKNRPGKTPVGWLAILASRVKP